MTEYMTSQQRAPEVQSRRRLVVSFTTVPWRLHNLPRTLALLAQQTRQADAIYLGIPQRCRRNNEAYPPLPASIFEAHPHFSVVGLETDYGAVSKVLGAVLRESDPETLIVTIDDDLAIIPPRLLQMFEVHANSHRNVVWALCGHQIGRFPFKHGIAGVSNRYKNLPQFIQNPMVRDPQNRHPVLQVLFGVGGVCYPRKTMPSTDAEWDRFLKYSQSPQLMEHDDIWLSAYLSECGTKIYRLPDAVSMLYEYEKDDDKRGLSNQNGFHARYVKAIDAAKRLSDGKAFANANMGKIENPASTLTFWGGVGGLVLAATLFTALKKPSRQKARNSSN